MTLDVAKDIYSASEIPPSPVYGGGLGRGRSVRAPILAFPRKRGKGIFPSEA